MLTRYLNYCYSFFSVAYRLLLSLGHQSNSGQGYWSNFRSQYPLSGDSPLDGNGDLPLDGNGDLRRTAWVTSLVTRMLNCMTKFQFKFEMFYLKPHFFLISREETRKSPAPIEIRTRHLQNQVLPLEPTPHLSSPWTVKFRKTCTLSTPYRKVHSLWLP